MEPHVTHCGGLSLRTGSIIIGIAGSIAALFALERGITYGYSAREALDGNGRKISKGEMESLIVNEAAGDKHRDKRSKLPGMFFATLALNGDLGTGAMGAIKFYMMNIVFSVGQLILSTMMVIGVSKRNPMMIRPWITAALIRDKVYLILYVTKTAMFLSAPATMPAIVGFMWCTFVTSSYLYFTLVVSSFYKEITTVPQVVTE